MFVPKLRKVHIPKDQDDVFLVMDYFKSDLKKLMNSKTQLSEQHVIVIMYNLLCAVNFIHTANIIHRDIKPANVLIDTNCNVRICDFGLSRSAVDEEQKDGRKKRSLSKHVQSRWYRAPEVILTEREYDQAIDMWSVGCILAELLSCYEA